MENKKHKVIVEFVRDTEEDLPYSRSFNPMLPDTQGLGELVLDEIRKAQLNENITEGDVKVVQVIDDTEEVEKQESEALKHILRAREVCRTILTSTTITDEMRKDFLGFFEETNNYEKEMQVIKVPFTGTTTNIKTKIHTQDYKFISDLIRQGHKIPAIKKVRELTKWGLKDSKDCVDQWAF